MVRPVSRIAIACIVCLWQRAAGPWYNRKRRIICRFYPSCSEYAVRAIEKYGCIRGGIRAVKRIRRCNPDNTESCIDPP